MFFFLNVIYESKAIGFLQFSLLISALFILPCSISSFLSEMCSLRAFCIIFYRSSWELYRLKLYFPQSITHPSFPKALQFYLLLIYKNKVGSIKVHKNENNAFHFEIFVYYFLLFQKVHKLYSLSSSSNLFESTRVNEIERKKSRKKRND